MKGRAILFMAMTAILLTGLFYLLRPLSEVADPDAARTPGPVQKATPAVVELVVRNQALVSGPATIRVRQGDLVTIRVIADVAEEFHLHGYDRKLDLEAGVPAELKLLADRSGRFEYELEKSRIELGVLEVLPP